MIEIPNIQEEIDKQKKIPALVKNKFGAEIVIDLYTAKRLASNNECEIIAENFTTKKVDKTKEKTETPKGDEGATK